MPSSDRYCIFFTCCLLLLGAAVTLTSEPAAAQNPPLIKADNSRSLERGQRLLTQYQCGSCHAIPGVAAARGMQGPTLEAFGRRSYIAGRIPNRADNLARWIVKPSALVFDTSMPSMGVSPDHARDMAAYLGSLK